MKLKQKVQVRLPNHIVPKRYSITLFPNLKEFTFGGEVEILLNLTKPVSEITLHAAELKITAAVLRDGTTELKSQSISYNEKLETATMFFEKKTQAEETKLQLKFTGILNDKMRGFYRSRYQHGGKEHYMAVTQFESTDARRAFPSFDEPAKKAVFDVKLIIPQDHTAISNTVETEVAEHSPGYKVVTFAPTPKMSTYLAAFIVGKFEFIESRFRTGSTGQVKTAFKVRVFTTFGKKHQAKFALSTAVRVLEFYEDYFGIKYPLPVLDLIAIPDFAAGAMENWGAVTYRETALLVDEELSSTANKQWVALVIAHELAHMWFGNLVTMQWWTHLWLNEGFASYIEYLAVDSIFPDWHIWKQFVFMDHARALELDGLKNTHPIEVAVRHPGEISEIFDAVSYSKGASVIRMLAVYLGEKNFQKGLQIYLEKHKYGNAATVDLWKALEKASGKKVEKIMENWTGKPGYPLVIVSDVSKKLKLTQTRFFSSPISAKKSYDKTVWLIPIDSFLFSKKTILMPKQKEQIKLNRGETSLVRIKYSAENLQLLQDSIEEKKVSAEDRFGIVRDAYALAQSGHMATDKALELTLSYKKENEYIVWAQIAADLRTLDNLISSEKFHVNFRKYCREIFAVITVRIGWDKKPQEEHAQTLLRSIVLFAAGTFGDKAIIAKAKDLFKSIVESKSKIDSDLRGLVYNLVAENGEDDEYAMLKNLYDKTPFQEEKDRIFRALCLFKDVNLLTKTLTFAFSQETRAQDRFKAVSFVWANPAGRDLAWDFLQKNWKLIQKTFAGGHLYPRFIQPAVNFVDSKKALEIEKFFKKNPSPGLERTIAQVTEQIRANSLWLSRDKSKISEFLRKA